MRYQRALAAGTLALGLVLTGCGDDTGGTEKSTSATTKDYSKGDVSFAQGMIPHHRQAVQMADLAETRAGAASVKKLASTIKGAQDPEIRTMTGWLKEWGQDVPVASGHGGDDHGGDDHGGADHGHAEMPGMMSAEDMTKLEGLTAAAFDREFLTMMIAHHAGAIEMARTEQRKGRNDEAVALAKTIESAQAAEITTMKRLLAAS